MTTDSDFSYEQLQVLETFFDSYLLAGKDMPDNTDPNPGKRTCNVYELPDGREMTFVEGGMMMSNGLDAGWELFPGTMLTVLIAVNMQYGQATAEAVMALAYTIMLDKSGVH